MEKPPRNPVAWFEIYVQDMARAKKFYETVLRVTLTPLGTGEMEAWAFPWSEKEPGIGGALVKIPGVRSGGNSTMVYFECDDCAVEVARVPSAGGAIDRLKTPIGPYGFIALALDSEDNRIGFHSRT